MRKSNLFTYEFCHMLPSLCGLQGHVSNFQYLHGHTGHLCWLMWTNGLDLVFFLMLNIHTMQAATRSQVEFMDLHWISNGYRSQATESKTDVSSSISREGCCSLDQVKGIVAGDGGDPLRMWLFVQTICRSTGAFKTWLHLLQRISLFTGLQGGPYDPSPNPRLPISEVSFNPDGFM